jgi:hypothetical protein
LSFSTNSAEHQNHCQTHRNPKTLWEQIITEKLKTRSVRGHQTLVKNCHPRPRSTADALGHARSLLAG